MKSISPDIEAHLDSVFEKGAHERAQEMSGKMYSYRLDSIGFTVPDEMNKKIGTCKVLDVRYDKTNDCNFYKILDLETNHESEISQFEIWFSEIE